MMPIAMLVGIVLHPYLSYLAFITPALIFVMLFISYSNISLKSIRITRLHIYLLLIQVLGSILVYSLIRWFDPVVAQGAMICILAPTATSAIVITGMLGGNMISLASYTLLSNMAVVISAPIIFVMTGYDGGISFFDSSFIIFKRVFLILLLPFLVSMLLRKVFPLMFEYIQKRQRISFYLWVLALTIVTANIVTFIREQETGNYRSELIIAFLSMLACVAQFYIGRKLGRKFDDTVAGGQGLGQKNTVLAIWMAQTYLNPITSIGPGMYVLWQNIINSYQVWRKNRS